MDLFLHPCDHKIKMDLFVLFVPRPVQHRDLLSLQAKLAALPDLTPLKE